MKCEIIKPNTLDIMVKPDKEDDWYTKCLWLRISFDLDNWSMNCNSDCGDYAYSWCVESGKRSFLELMAQINESYLLGKVSRETKFDRTATLDQLTDYVGEEELTDEQKEWINECCSSSGEEFINELDESGLFDDLCDTWELPQYDYPNGAKTFAMIFTEIIQPRIKEYLENSNG